MSKMRRASGGSVFDIMQFNSDNTIEYNYRNKRVMYGVLS